MATNPAYPVPHLTTALTGPLRDLETHILHQQIEIESWFRYQWRETPAPFYASVDLRNAGFKIAPVDTNLFPAGFNNLNPAFESLCIQSIQLAAEHLSNRIDRILIIPESHTRNQFYMRNIAVLQQIIERAGFDVRVGSLLPDLEEPIIVKLETGRTVILEPLERDGNRILIQDFNPDLIILNNDMTSGHPPLLQDIEQPITPPLQMGWSHRLKSVHFGFYQQVAKEFTDLLGIDPWLIEPMFSNCGEVDFMKREGESCLSKNIEELLNNIQKKYDEYGVEHKPFIIIKADAGTYGMSVMTVHSPGDIIELNRKQRTRMSTTKEGQKVTSVIIQEGIYTLETWNDANTVAEPVVYMIDKNVVGGFYRVHAKRATDENLNYPGMRFERLAFDDCCISPDKNQSPNAHPNRFYTYGVIARLALLAAAREISNFG